jgi:hypothetical protein
MATYDEHLLRRRCHEHVPGMKLKMEESIGVEKGNCLADIEEITDESGQLPLRVRVTQIQALPQQLSYTTRKTDGSPRCGRRHLIGPP